MSKAFRLPFLLVALALGAFCASAKASPVTIGQLAPSNPPAVCSSGPTDAFQASLSSGSDYVVPAPGGAITSWSTNAAAGVGQTLKLKVFRRLSGSTYTVLAHDGPRPLLPSALNTFAVSIPVQAGDLIGVNDQNATTVHSACLFVASAGDVFGAGSLEDGADAASEELKPVLGGFRLNLSATILPPPTISALTPLSGSIKGGTDVVIAGANFAEVRSVAFGSAPATSYTVNSEGQITAVAPAGASLTSTPITVATIAGTATSPTTFAYEGCVVPRLTGKKLKTSKKKLKRADCKLGKVKKLKGTSAKTGKVKKQNPKAGKVLAPGSKVSVKLG